MRLMKRGMDGLRAPRDSSWNDRMLAESANIVPHYDHSLEVSAVTTVMAMTKPRRTNYIGKGRGIWNYMAL